MSIYVDTYISCDNCGQEISVSTDRRRARKYAKSLGWKRRKGKEGFLDICPGCIHNERLFDEQC